MAHSDPALREHIATQVKQCGMPVIKAETMEELKELLGLTHESNSRVDQALRSLHYNDDYAHTRVNTYRPRFGSYGHRPYRLSYAGA